MNVEQWNSAIYGAFFDENHADRDVYLCVDDETLKEIGEEHGLHGDDAVADFERAAQSVTRQGRDPFEGWRYRVSEWEKEGRPAPPPFIALLGATVLAATRRVSGEGAGRPPYYSQLTPILGASPDWDQNKYRNFIPDLWGRLHTWLDDDQFGRLGRPTAWAWEHFEQYIGFSSSQAILSGNDRERLHRFFQDAGFEPGSEVEPDELIARLRQWSRAGGHVSPKLLRLVDDEELREHVRKIIAAELRHWDGTVRTRQGHRVFDLVLMLDMRRHTLGLALRLPVENRPNDVIVEGRQYQVDSAVPCLSMPLAPDRALLDEGVRLADRKMRMVYRPRLVVPFVFDEDIGSWISATRTQLDKPHCVLVHDDVADAAVRLMQELGGAPRQTHKVELPRGWSLFKGFEPTVSLVRVEPELTPLVPAASALPSLQGGLRVVSGQRTYLVGGAPDLVVPGLVSHRLEVRVDGAHVVDVGEDGAVLPLEDQGLRGGEHTVSVGSWKGRLTMVREVVECPMREPHLGHHLVKSESGFAATGPAAAVSLESRYASTVVVSGAALDFIEDGEGMRFPEPPAMIKLAPRGYLALGQPGEVAKFDVAQPRWARQLGLDFNSFEVEDQEMHHGFSFLFVARLFSHKTVIVGARDKPFETLTAQHESAAAWAKAVAEIATSEKVEFSASGTEERWSEYAEIALEVLGDD